MAGWGNPVDRERTALLIDGANCYETCKRIHYRIDYSKLLRIFNPRQAYYFTALPENDKSNPNNIFPMIDFITYNGYNLITKDMKTFINGGVVQTKGNMDVEITVHILKAARWASHIVLLSGDGDFCMALREVQDMGVRVTVVSALDVPAHRGEKQSPMVADELRRQANTFIDLCNPEFRVKIELTG